MQSIYRIGALCALIVSGAVSAQSLPKPQEFYFDQDKPVTQPLEVVRGDDDAAIRRLRQIAERNDRNADKAHAQLAGVFMANGQVGTGKDLYQQLVQRLDTNNVLRRAVLWRYGWALYRAGEPEAALAQWRELVVGRGINPAWAPPTLALAFWKLERRDEAVDWYAAAVRSEPRQWSGTDMYPQLLPDWSEQERKDLAEVQAAWAAKRPTWP
jgi:tetratricopeptide (TPR) repeat protein